MRNDLSFSSDITFLFHYSSDSQGHAYLPSKASKRYTSWLKNLMWRGLNKAKNPLKLVGWLYNKTLSRASFMRDRQVKNLIRLQFQCPLFDLDFWPHIAINHDNQISINAKLTSEVKGSLHRLIKFLYLRENRHLNYLSWSGCNSVSLKVW